MVRTMPPLDNPAPFADPLALLAAALDAYLPPNAVTVADHAAAHRWLDNRGGGYVGRWSHDEAPYLREPMLALTSRAHTTVAVAGPGRSGKTAIAENWLLQSADADPADMLWYEPTDDALESYVKRVINPMIELHEPLHRRLGTMPVDRSLHFKRFGPMWAEFLAATYQNLVGKSAGRIVVDEYDACSERDGDAYDLADIRRQSFGPESMILALSHPDRAEGTDPRAWTRGIMRLYADSDRRTWWWPCPHCNGFSSPNPTAARFMPLHYPEAAPLDEVAEAARLICPLCASPIEDKWRRAMNLEGRWVGLGQTIGEDGEISGALLPRSTAGFWIVGVMSPFILGGIGALARALVGAEKQAEAEGSDKPVRDVMAKRWGIPPAPRRNIGSIDAATLAERAEDTPLGLVPRGVRFLTAFLDVQANRFELLVRGWGEHGESWVVDFRRIEAETATSPADWDAAIRAALDAEYPLDDATGRVMRVRGVGYDSGGAPGVTEQAYAVWKRLRAAGRARRLGVVGGRDVWTLLPTKGSSTPNAPRLQVNYPDTARKDRKTALRGEVPLGAFNANQFKDSLAGQLATGLPGKGFVHLPAALRSPQPPHAWFEQLTAERRRPNGAWEKIGRANEALDLMIGTHVIAHLHGLSRINWNAPPAWAAAWDVSSSVAKPTTPAGTLVKLVQALTPPAAVRPAKFNPAAQRMGRRLA
jgi:phage terminase large subunit GpA-like protein